MSMIGISTAVMVFGVAIAAKYDLCDRKRSERYRSMARVRNQDISD